MTAVFNIKSNKEWVARLYFQLDPTGKLFYSTIIFLNEKSKTLVDTDINNLESKVRQELNNSFGQNKYEIIPSKPAERKDYEREFYSKFFLNE